MLTGEGWISSEVYRSGRENGRQIIRCCNSTSLNWSLASCSPCAVFRSCISKSAGKPVAGKSGNIGNAEYSSGTGERCAGIGIRKILITKGELTGFQNLKISPETGSILNLEWEDNSTQSNAKEADLVNLICYLETQNAFVIFEGLAARKLIKATAKLPDVYQGKEVHTWAFLNNEKKHRPAPVLTSAKLP